MRPRNWVYQEPMVLAGCMKWGARAGILHLDHTEISLTFHAPDGFYFFGHGLFTPDIKTLMFSSTRGSDETGHLLFFDVAAGTYLDRLEASGTPSHEILWTEPGEEILVTQCQRSAKNRHTGLLTYVNLKIRKTERSFDSELPASHCLYLGEHTYSVALTEHNADPEFLSAPFWQLCKAKSPLPQSLHL